VPILCPKKKHEILEHILKISLSPTRGAIDLDPLQIIVAKGLYL
jgi:hypothetical protein